MFVFLNKNVICHSNDLYGLYFEARFFECFALGTSEHVFALIKMPAREGPLSYCRAGSKQVEMNSLLNKHLHSFKGDKSQSMILENSHVPVPKRPIRCPATIRPSSSLMIAITATRGWSPLHAISLGPVYGFSRQRMLQLYMLQRLSQKTISEPKVEGGRYIHENSFLLIIQQRVGLDPESRCK